MKQTCGLRGRANREACEERRKQGQQEKLLELTCGNACRTELIPTLPLRRCCSSAWQRPVPEVIVPSGSAGSASACAEPPTTESGPWGQGRGLHGQDSGKGEQGKGQRGKAKGPDGAGKGKASKEDKDCPSASAGDGGAALLNTPKQDLIRV